MARAEPIDVAVVGVGRMGRHHARVYAQHAEANLVAIVDEDAQRANTVADEFGCAAYLCIDDLLRTYPRLRAVTVAVPTVSHVSVAEALVERGVACLVEKPLASTADEARELAEFAQRHGVILQAGHTERFNPAVQAVQAMNITPRFMEVVRISPMTFRSLDVSVVMDVMIHDLDIVLMLADAPVERIDAVGVAVLGEYEDVANARLTFTSGCVANLTASRLALKTDRRMRLFSETAYVSLNYMRRSGMVIHKTGNQDTLATIRARIAAGEDLSDLDYSQLVQHTELTMGDDQQADPLTMELTEFLSAVRENRPPTVDADAGVAAVEAAQQVIAAIKQHHWEGLTSSHV